MSRPWARRALLIVPALVFGPVLLIGAAAGCSKDNTSGDSLPAGQALLTDSANAMRDITGAHVAISAEGEISALPLRRAEGDLTKQGDAKGTIQLQQFGTLIEYQFVLVGDSIYLKGATGPWQKLPASVAASIYDPSAILDPDRGVAKILSTATDATTEAKESVEGKDTYRIAAKLDNTAVSALVPGVGAGVSGKLWIEVDTKQLRKAVFTVPAATGNQSGTVTVLLTDINKPISVSAPS